MRPYWKAIYHYGSDVLEFMPGGIVSDFYDIDKERLARFELVCSHDLIVGFDTATGIFYLNGQEFTDPSVSIAYNLPVEYAQGLIQFKKAYVGIGMTDIDGELPIIGDEVLDSVNIGYKVTYENTLIQIVMGYDPTTQLAAFEVKVTNLETQETLSNRLEVV